MALVYQGESGRLEGHFAQDVLDVQEIEQRRAEARRIGKGRDPVEDQLALGLQVVEKFDIAAGDQGVVASDVLQPIGHARVGVKGPLSGVKSADAENVRIL